MKIGNIGTGGIGWLSPVDRYVSIANTEQAFEDYGGAVLVQPDYGKSAGQENVTDLYLPGLVIPSVIVQGPKDGIEDLPYLWDESSMKGSFEAIVNPTPYDFPLIKNFLKWIKDHLPNIPWWLIALLFLGIGVFALLLITIIIKTLF